jgi:hypothetical protein
MKAERGLSKEVFPKNRFPELYSKRGFEKSRVRICVPKSRTELVPIRIWNEKLIIF